MRSALSKAGYTPTQSIISQNLQISRVFFSSAVRRTQHIVVTIYYMRNIYVLTAGSIFGSGFYMKIYFNLIFTPRRGRAYPSVCAFVRLLQWQGLPERFFILSKHKFRKRPCSGALTVPVILFGIYIIAPFLPYISGAA